MKSLTCVFCMGVVLVIFEGYTQPFVLGRPATIQDVPAHETANSNTNLDDARSSRSESWNSPSLLSAPIAGLTSQETFEVVDRILHGQLQPGIGQPIEIGNVNHLSRSPSSSIVEVPFSVAKPSLENSRSGKLILAEYPNPSKVIFEAIPVAPTQSFIRERPVVLDVHPKQDVPHFAVLRDPVIVESPFSSDRIIGSGFLETPTHTNPQIQETVYLEPINAPKLATLHRGRGGELVLQQIPGPVLNNPIETSQVMSDSSPFIVSFNANRALMPLSTMNEDLSSKMKEYSNINTNTYDASAFSSGTAQQSSYPRTFGNSYEKEETTINNATNGVITFPSANNYYNSVDGTKLVPSKDTVFPITKRSSVPNSFERFRNIDEDLLAMSNIEAPGVIADSALVSSEEFNSQDRDELFKLLAGDEESLSNSEQECLDEFRKSLFSSEETESKLTLPSSVLPSSKGNDNSPGRKNGNEDLLTSEVNSFLPQTMDLSKGLNTPQKNFNVEKSLPDVFNDFGSLLSEKEKHLSVSPQKNQNGFEKTPVSSGENEPILNLPSATGMPPSVKDIGNPSCVRNEELQRSDVDSVLPLTLDVSHGLDMPNTNFDVESPSQILGFESESSEEKFHDRRNFSEFDETTPTNDRGNFDDTVDIVSGTSKDSEQFSVLKEEENLKNGENAAIVKDNISEENLDDGLNMETLKNLHPIRGPDTEEVFEKLRDHEHFHNIYRHPSLDMSQHFNVVTYKPLKESHHILELEEKANKWDLTNSTNIPGLGGNEPTNLQANLDISADAADRPVPSLNPVDYETQSSEDRLHSRRKVGAFMDDFVEGGSLGTPANFDFSTVPTNEPLGQVEKALDSDEENSLETSPNLSESESEVKVTTEIPQIFGTSTTIKDEDLELLETNFGSEQQNFEETINEQRQDADLEDHASTVNPKMFYINKVENLGTTKAVSEAQAQLTNQQTPETVYSLQHLNDEAANSKAAMRKFRQGTRKRSVDGDILPGVEEFFPGDLEQLDEYSDGVNPTNYVNVSHNDTRFSLEEPEIFTTDEPLSAEEQPPIEYAVLNLELTEPSVRNHITPEVESIEKISDRSKELNAKPTDLQSVAADFPPPNTNHSVEKKDDPLHTLEYRSVHLPSTAAGTQQTVSKPHKKDAPNLKKTSSSLNALQTTTKLLTAEDVARNISEHPAKSTNHNPLVNSDLITQQATLPDGKVADRTQPQTANGTFSGNTSDVRISRRRRSNGGVDPFGRHYSDVRTASELPRSPSTLSEPNAVLLSTATEPPRPSITTAITPPSTVKNSDLNSTKDHFHSAIPLPQTAQTSTTANLTSQSPQEIRPTTFEPLPTPLPETTATSNPLANTTPMSNNSTITKKKKTVWKIPFYPNNIAISSNGDVRLEPKDNQTSNIFPSPKPAGRGNLKSLISKSNDEAIESARQQLFTRLRSRRPSYSPISDADLIEQNRFRRPEATGSRLRTRKLSSASNGSPTTRNQLLSPNRVGVDDVVSYFAADDASQLPTALYNSPEEREEARRRRFRTMIGLAGDVRSLMADRAKKAVGTFAEIVGTREGDGKRVS